MGQPYGTLIGHAIMDILAVTFLADIIYGTVITSITSRADLLEVGLEISNVGCIKHQVDNSRDIYVALLHCYEAFDQS